MDGSLAAHVGRRMLSAVGLRSVAVGVVVVVVQHVRQQVLTRDDADDAVPFVDDWHLQG